MIADAARRNKNAAVQYSVSAYNSPVKYRGVPTSPGVIAQEAVTGHTGFFRGYRIVGNPAGSFLAEIPFRLDKAAKVPGPDILSNIPKGTDAVHPREFRVGNPGNLIFRRHLTFPRSFFGSAGVFSDSSVSTYSLIILRAL